MTTPRGFALLGLAIGLLVAAGAKAQIVSSDFALGDDGWVTVGNYNGVFTTLDCQTLNLVN